LEQSRIEKMKKYRRIMLHMLIVILMSCYYYDFL